MFLGAPAIALALSNDCMVVSFSGKKKGPSEDSEDAFDGGMTF